MGNDGQVSIWSIPERAEITAFLNAVTALAVHPAGTTLAGASLDQTIFIWDLQSESLRRELAGHDSAVHCLAYSPDGNWLVSGGADLALRVWDANGEQVAVVELHSQPTSVTFSADGTCLYVGHANTTCSQFHVHDLLPKN
jgi:WD40 repeat protein